jgi:hypothetical protein
MHWHVGDILAYLFNPLTAVSALDDNHFCVRV